MLNLKDSNRLGLSLVPVDHIRDMKADSLSMLLRDKDKRFPPFTPPSDDSYLPLPPTAKAYADRCNEFWWVSPYTDKALARGQIFYAHHLLDGILRVELMKMLTLRFGILTDFKSNPGKYRQHFKDQFPAVIQKQILKTYADAVSKQNWNSLEDMGDFFEEAAQNIADHFDWIYPKKDAERVRANLQFLRQYQTQ